MIEIQVEARSVQIGDELFNAPSSGRKPYHPAFQWVRVTKVDVSNEVVRIDTTAWVTWKNVREGVLIRRPCECD